IKLIELSKSGDAYRVESYAAEPSPPNAINEKAIVDAQAVGEAVRRAVKRAGARSGEVAVAISGDAALAARERARVPGRDAGRPVHPLPHGGSQLRLRGGRTVGEGPRHVRRAA